MMCCNRNGRNSYRKNGSRQKLILQIVVNLAKGQCVGVLWFLLLSGCCR